MPDATDATFEAGATFDADHFRHVLGHFASGITVITSTDEQGPVGFTAQSFTSLSLDPPLVLICPAKSSTSWPRIEATGGFCVNVLAEDQEDLGRTFARSGADKFAGLDFGVAAGTGSPLLVGCLAWIDCRVEAIHDGGDHLIVVGRVLDLGVSGDVVKPLLFHRATYGRLEA